MPTKSLLLSPDAFSSFSIELDFEALIKHHTPVPSNLSDRPKAYRTLSYSVFMVQIKTMMWRADNNTDTGFLLYEAEMDPTS
mmetsp:Transcript_37002/g.48720  ORF Transcript_37002/g.48720 Transcript_37002/m.48720 type:complete len:82 (-) Transcript_37002:40-285(-)